MSITIKDYIKNCKFVLSNILDEQERIVLANENIIVNINKNQFTDGYGSDNKDLNNIIKEYTGFYKSGSPSPACIIRPIWKIGFTETPEPVGTPKFSPVVLKSRLNF